MDINKEMLELLLCPKCKGNVVLDDAGDRIICKQCRLCYEIKDGIPIMLIDEAKPIEEDDV
jgi:uncharacterized protein YbaR (Trm112 family)